MITYRKIRVGGDAVGDIFFPLDEGEGGVEGSGFMKNKVLLSSSSMIFGDD